MLELPTCTCGTSSKFVQILQKQVLQFLLGLKDVFKIARGNILMMHPLPNLNQAYRLILQEERQRECGNIGKINHDSAALISSSNDRNVGGYNNHNRF